MMQLVQLRHSSDPVTLFLQVLPYEPVPCKQCGAILNPYASVDYYAKIWVCPICYTRCHFPPHYQGISEQNVPAELFPQYTTVEYTLNRTVPPHPPTYLFVVDTAVAEDELHACKTAITQVRDTTSGSSSSFVADVRWYSSAPISKGWHHMQQWLHCLSISSSRAAAVG
jgi:hypothetical protein